MKINWKKVGEAIKSAAQRAWARVQSEPVLVRTALTTLVGAGVLELTDVQLDRIDAIVLVVVLLGGAASARGAVTPLDPSERHGALGWKKKVRRNGGGK